MSTSLSIFSKVKVILSAPLLVAHLLLYHFSKNKDLIASDVAAWRRYRSWVPKTNIYWALMCMIVLLPEYRMQFNLRIGRIVKFLWFYNNERGDLGQCHNIGKGFCLIHGYGTVINGSSQIGDYCTVLHGVTIGGGRGGSPIIGNNVYIGAGAIIIGKIMVGDNVNIGAGTVVVNDIPANCTVIGQKPRIIQH